MAFLFTVSFVWAFSFGLIKGRLAGVDSTAIATLRLALALLVFLPFFRRNALPWRAALRLVLIGAIQFGIMYLLYLRAYVYLQAFEIALLTITTPIFVAALDAALERRWLARHVIAALLSVAGAGVVLWHEVVTSDRLLGVLLVQASNLCFAAGQLAWRRERPRLPATTSDASIFALPYAGALAVSIVWSLFTTDWPAFRVTPPQAATLVYLGVLASGVCFFWWNLGATRVNTGTLAAFNNAKIPLAVACSLLFFHESTDLTRLLIGGGLMAVAVWVAELKRAP
jgi:drug/metabolite transporter (DMT)-like permease